MSLAVRVVRGKPLILYVVRPRRRTIARCGRRRVRTFILNILRLGEDMSLMITWMRVDYNFVLLNSEIVWLKI